MLCWLSNGNNKTRIGEQLEYVLQACDVVIAFGQVSPSAAGQQQLADMLLIEILKGGMLFLAIHEVTTGKPVAIWEEVHP